MEYLSPELEAKFKKAAAKAAAKTTALKEEKKAAAKPVEEQTKAEKATLKGKEKVIKKVQHDLNKDTIMRRLKELRSDVLHKPVSTVKGLFMKAKKDTEIGKQVTMEDVKQFWRGTAAGQTKPYTGYNSYTASLPREQYHVDIAYMSKAKTKEEAKKMGGFLPEDEGRKEENIEDDNVEEVEPEAPKGKKGLKNIPMLYGFHPKAFICVDVFSKKVSVTGIDGTTPEEALKGMVKAIEQLGPPKEVFTDDGGEFKGQFAAYLKEQGIQHIVTRNHAMFAERFTRYLRWHLHDRQAAHGGDWGVWAQDVVKRYNEGTDEKPTHATTKLSPNEGHQDKNALDVKLNLVMAAKRNRTYPELREGDQVKIHQKKTRGQENKEVVPVWSPGTFTVKEIKQEGNHTYYVLDPRPKGLKAEYLRHAFLLVS